MCNRMVMSEIRELFHMGFVQVLSISGAFSTINIIGDKLCSQFAHNYYFCMLSCQEPHTLKSLEHKIFAPFMSFLIF